MCSVTLLKLPELRCRFFTDMSINLHDTGEQVIIWYEFQFFIAQEKLV